MGYIDKDKQREYARQWIANRRANFFNGKTCVRCGSSENLELDHIDPKQKVSHSIWSWSESRRLAEIAKCQVLCRICHQLKTADDFGYELYAHPSISTYNKGCRCFPCVEFHAMKCKEWRTRTGYSRAANSMVRIGDS